MESFVAEEGAIAVANEAAHDVSLSGLSNHVTRSAERSSWRLSLLRRRRRKKGLSRKSMKMSSKMMEQVLCAAWCVQRAAKGETKPKTWSVAQAPRPRQRVQWCQPQKQQTS